MRGQHGARHLVGKARSSASESDSTCNPSRAIAVGTRKQAIIRLTSRFSRGVLVGRAARGVAPRGKLIKETKRGTNAMFKMNQSVS